MITQSVRDAIPKPKQTECKLGVGWRPELALAISRRKDLSFVEIVAENHMKNHRLPDSLLDLKKNGVEIIPHCISLAPGGSKKPDFRKIKLIDQLAQECGAKIVSDHMCFVRAAELESGHLLPVPRNETTMRVLLDNILYIKEHLSVPFALENIASLCDWENSDYDEASFFAELLERSDCLMLLDVANLYANSINHKFDPLEYLQRLPLHRIAYVHIAGGTYRDNLYHDTHAHPVIMGAYGLLQKLSSMIAIPKIMLERDDNFPTELELNRELDLIKWISNNSVLNGPQLRENNHE